MNKDIYNSRYKQLKIELEAAKNLKPGKLYKNISGDMLYFDSYDLDSEYVIELPHEAICLYLFSFDISWNRFAYGGTMEIKTAVWYVFKYQDEVFISRKAEIPYFLEC